MLPLNLCRNTGSLEFLEYLGKLIHLYNFILFIIFYIKSFVYLYLKYYVCGYTSIIFPHQYLHRVC